MGGKVFQRNAEQAGSDERVLQERVRGSTVAIQERMDRKDLDVEPRRWQDHLIKVHRVSLVLSEGRVVELGARAVQAFQDTCPGRCPCALQDRALGGAQRDSVLRLLAAL